MGRQISYLVLLCLLCSLYESVFLEGASAHPTVTAWIVTPERDQKIGGRVEMRCVATNLEEDHVVDWETQAPILTLRWGNQTIGGTDPRFLFETKKTGNKEITQEFNITDLQRSDDDKYVCNVKNPLRKGGSLTLASSTIRLRVYSSNESFPICSPEGPITVDAGTQVNMRCSSDTGNSTIIISHNSSMSKYCNWKSTIVSGKSFSFLDVILDVSDDNLTFQCFIPSLTLPGTSHSCVIGPINVRAKGGIDTDIAMITVEPTRKSYNLDPLIAALSASIVLLALSIIINILVIFRNRNLKRHIEALIKETTPVPKADPYMELEPRGNSKGEYTAPEARGPTTAHHIYCQSVNEHTEDDYEQPQDKEHYEAVRVSKDEDKKYQNVAN